MEPQSSPFLFDPRFLSAARKLDRREQKNVWKALEGLQYQPPLPGLKVERVRDARKLDSCRISRKYRIIFWRPRRQGAVVLLFVGHHDDAYKFAIRWRPSQVPGHISMALEGLCSNWGPRSARVARAGAVGARWIVRLARKLAGRQSQDTCVAPLTLDEIRRAVETDAE